jgi:16S rRNA (cytosine1402-N4)-methyltransferase
MNPHVPVLLEEATDLLTGNRGKVFLDCTLGGGGHARRVLEKVPDCYLIGIDWDEEAIEVARESLKDFEGRFSIYKANFADLDLVLKEEGVERVDGILFDLGLSTIQLKSSRGFSFQRDDPLDMRMDKDQRLTAYDVVNRYPERELERILREYGEERLAGGSPGL